MANLKKRVVKRYSKHFKTWIVRTNLSAWQNIQTTPSRLVHSHPISERGSSFMIQKPGQRTIIPKADFFWGSFLCHKQKATTTGWCEKAPRIPHVEKMIYDDLLLCLSRSTSPKNNHGRVLHPGKFHMLKPKNPVFFGGCFKWLSFFNGPWFPGFRAGHLHNKGLPPEPPSRNRRKSPSTQRKGHSFPHRHVRIRHKGGAPRTNQRESESRWNGAWVYWVFIRNHWRW